MLTLLLFLAAWFPIQGLSYAAEPKEYLVNGGFEDASGGIPSHWSAYNATFTQVDSPKRSGGFAGALGPASGGSVTVWAYQTVPDIAPGAYRLSGYVWKNDPHVSAVLLRIRWQAEDGSQIGIIDSPQLTGDSPSFQFLSTSEVSAPANARTASIRILLTNGSAEKGVVYVEDLSFQGPVPSPPTPTHTATSVPSPTTVPPTATPTVTLTFTRTPTAVPSVTASPTLTRTPTPRPTATPTRTLTPTPTLVPVTQASPGEVLINEFQFDPIQGGVDAPHEWVELYNRTDHTITLQGWGLRDNQERDTIPSLTLPAGGFAIVAASSSFTANFPGFSGAVVLIEDGTIGNGLSNQGDRLVLEDGAGQIIDQLSYGSDASFFNPLLPPIAAGHSYERRFPGLDTDQAADFCENPSPSPGHASPCQGTPTASATPSPLPTSTPQPAPTIVAAAVTPSASFTATVSPVTPTATLISEVLAIMVEASPTAGNLVETRQSASASATSPKELQAVLIAGALLVAVAGWVSVQWWRRNSLRGR